MPSLEVSPKLKTLAAVQTKLMLDEMLKECAGDLYSAQRTRTVTREEDKALTRIVAMLLPEDEAVSLRTSESVCLRYMDREGLEMDYLAILKSRSQSCDTSTRRGALYCLAIQMLLEMQGDSLAAADTLSESDIDDFSEEEMEEWEDKIVGIFASGAFIGAVDYAITPAQRMAHYRKHTQEYAKLFPKNISSAKERKAIGTARGQFWAQLESGYSSKEAATNALRSYRAASLRPSWHTAQFVENAFRVLGNIDQDIFNERRQASA